MKPLDREVVRWEAQKIVEAQKSRRRDALRRKSAGRGKNRARANRGKLPRSTVRDVVLATMVRKTAAGKVGESTYRARIYGPALHLRRDARSRLNAHGDDESDDQGLSASPGSGPVPYRGDHQGKTRGER